MKVFKNEVNINAIKKSYLNIIKNKKNSIKK